MSSISSFKAKLLKVPYLNFASQETSSGNLSQSTLHISVDCGSPHAVKSVKMHLRRIIGTIKLTFEELTILTQIEPWLNSRPLVSNDSHSDDGIEALKPGHQQWSRISDLQPSNYVATATDFESEGYVYLPLHNVEGGTTSPIKVPLVINDTPITMELDTGAAYYYDHFGKTLPRTLRGHPFGKVWASPQGILWRTTSMIGTMDAEV